MNSAGADLITLLLGLGGVLVVATLIGQVLKQALSRDGSNTAIENLNDRIYAWWAMVILMGLALVFGRTGVVVLFAFASFAALREFVTLTNTRRGDHWALAAAFFVILPAQYWYVWSDRAGIYTILVPVYAFLFLPIISAVRGDTSRFLVRIAEVQWALMICVYCASHVPALLNLDIAGYEGRNMLLIAFLVVVVQSSDVLQYVWGKLFGRTRIAPNLSPSKTLEGLVGGALSATALGAALAFMTPFSVAGAALLSFVIVVMGFLGGLVMSAIKRDRGVKDWGHMIAGHGGFIDRLDSVVFSAPIFYHLVSYFYAA